MRMLAALLVLAGGLAAIASGEGGLSQIGGKKTWVHPKTPWGDPDLQGMWPSGDMTGVPLQRPEAFGARAALTDEEFAQRQAALRRQYESFVIGAWGEQGKAQRQASLIVDPPNGRMPPMTAEGQKRSANVRSSWQNRETRIIPVDTRPRLGSAITQWAGESRGRWEGNVLVVETTNFNGKTAATNPGTTGSPAQNNVPTSESLRLVERFTRVDPDTIEYEVTIDDPIVFTAPWKVAYPLRRHLEYVIFEYACHETNYALKNLLTGSQAERAAAVLERPVR